MVRTKFSRADAKAYAPETLPADDAGGVPQRSAPRQADSLLVLDIDIAAIIAGGSTPRGRLNDLSSTAVKKNKSKQKGNEQKKQASPLKTSATNSNASKPAKTTATSNGSKPGSKK
ncbi:hypothetical protein NM688_g4567 [Phlebia brevispora]|uniref:Uncharacterized protein n=1 Tax=Phlebia brevispora TaxID=194682 RepID=A0ACC1T2L1_9APHY|nr:hypothetical protein NM688_g4567 [Phlebia brevispora]